MTRSFRYFFALTFLFSLTLIPLLPVLFSQEEEEPEEKGEFRAVLIGIDDYKIWPGDKEYAKLNYCVKDIEEIASILKENGYKEENITVIKEEKTGRETFPATKHRINDKLTDVVSKCGRNDVLLVYFSGHGIHLDDQNYLVPYDGKYISKEQDPEVRSERKQTLINVFQIYDLLENNCYAKTKYFITDACQKNVLAPDKGTDPEKSTFQMNAKDIPPGLIQITSCSKGESSWEDANKGHGIFSAALIEGLKDKADANGDGRITIMELYNYVSKEVPKEAEKNFGESQNPSMESKFSGKGEIYFASNPKKISALELKMEAQILLKEAREEKSEEEKKSKLTTAQEKLDKAKATWSGGEYDYVYENLEKEIRKELEGLTESKVKKLAEEAWKLYDAQDFDTALEKCQAVLELDANNASIQRLQKLIEREKKPNPAKEAQKLAGEAWKLHQSQEYEEALEKINEAIEKDPENGSYQAIKTLIVTAMPPKAGDKKTITIKGIEYTFRWCPPGTFQMGDVIYDRHSVTLTKGFWMLEHEVTQKMWESIMGKNPSWFSSEGGGKDKISGSTAQYPVEEVSWEDCDKFIEMIQGSAPNGLKFSLPTEAQWEYTCRAGTTGDYGGTGNLDDMGWYDDNSDSKTHEVKKKTKNAWGLYDMHGNVWEWCKDVYDSDYYKNSPSTDPTGPDPVPNGGSERVYRGGSWSFDAGGCRSADRYRNDPSRRSNVLGFRLALLSLPER
ncbi:MAG: SUMF1/EgtB/PvdO family nonheme iron enzyme [Planctomycetia bacterium]|nr:SUMF1/EgtB/PvdO family nonheme iron enzyme [Planctomycetia bacterium]